MTDQIRLLFVVSCCLIMIYFCIAYSFTGPLLFILEINYALFRHKLCLKNKYVHASTSYMMSLASITIYNLSSFKPLSIVYWENSFLKIIRFTHWKITVRWWNYNKRCTWSMFNQRSFKILFRIAIFYFLICI